MAKEAGFRVGHLGSLFNGGRDGFMTISCRVAKLGISDEALQAWHLERSQYFIILIRYTDGYKPLDSLLGSGTSHGSGVQIRLGLSDKYKIALDEAIAAFTQLDDKSKSRKLLASDATTPPMTGGLGRVFIGRPLDELMNERLVPLLKYRQAMNFPWAGAEEFFNDHLGRNLMQEDSFDNKYWAPDGAQHIYTLPKLVTQDHLVDGRKEKSFPLLAMQFALRHLVRCTEFCLVCHCNVEADFEALKPYVCSKPLCLYQYMSLGFGPSIEHEIITQPHVVDLLISFCYASASMRKLIHLPTGMALTVPSPSLIQGAYQATPFPPMPGYYPGMTDGVDPLPTSKKTQKKAQDVNIYKAKFDRPKMELIFPPGAEKILHTGSWITFTAPGPQEERYHCRVIEVIHPTVRLGSPVVRSSTKGGRPQQPTTVSVSQRHLSGYNSANIPSTITPAATPPPAASTELLPNQLQEISFVVYDQNFDDLNDGEKASSICMMLDNLPSVQQMGNFLRSKGGQDTSLRNWADRISPAALGVLRWIIASNRSCIIQVDRVDGSARKSEERVSGMSGWMQFRFAQGAPDKEQRFVTSIRNTTGNQKYPTMFAWHGSPLHNWHGIVREGLHFKKADHGRAFGDGCYHSLDAGTSLGYSGMHMSGHGYGGYGDDSLSFGQWPHSQMKISQALALNEIVNSPSQFQSKSPHLVVAQLDWIQSRYLFVKCSIQGMQTTDSEPTHVYDQDPSYTPSGDQRKKVVIPITAVSKSRRPTEIKNGNKKVKVDNVQEAEEAALLSDETDMEDITIFFSDAEEPEVISTQASKGKGKDLPKLPIKPDASKTNFQPGTLDHKSLPLLGPPSFATSMATKALQKELTATLKVQETHPAHELGWYIDYELINNVYQWIVELHTFEPHLPLAKDMKSKNLKSVVMEVRFGKHYPMSPPFVRVIRPRFLSFMQGGGGHVTAGGALCMELLTNSGWSAVSNIESVLLQVRLAVSSMDPKPARLEPGPVRDYQVGEAVEAFIRACNTHGVSRLITLRIVASANTSIVGSTARLQINIFRALSIIRRLLMTPIHGWPLAGPLGTSKTGFFILSDHARSLGIRSRVILGSEEEATRYENVTTLNRGQRLSWQQEERLLKELRGYFGRQICIDSSGSVVKEGQYNARSFVSVICPSLRR